ncbi:hypothetical protein MUK42_34105 [Musa troglodytarum]|uniref:Uncharacterized protein n=1 Tax=Musa troglodytarum TaxID=320322 RepID=A0A9E7GQ03_9LILI|nr:hypothetical protein MUK42_34105 [Musa troglodytarum]
MIFTWRCRRDGTVSIKNESASQLPPPVAGISTWIDMFKAEGLTLQDLCSSISEAEYQIPTFLLPEGGSRELRYRSTQATTSRCRSEGRCSISHAAPLQDSQARACVLRHAGGSASEDDDFVDAMVKLGSIQVLAGAVEHVVLLTRSTSNRPYKSTTRIRTPPSRKRASGNGSIHRRYQDTSTEKQTEEEAAARCRDRCWRGERGVGASS